MARLFSCSRAGRTLDKPKRLTDTDRLNLMKYAGRLLKDDNLDDEILQLAMHVDSMKKKQAVYLFESSWKKKYTDRRIRKILARYSEEAGLTQNL
ncbi:hypothetical protein [Paenibacillus jiagnxiensis]|uniref:hypothetical protein n=1 Tax=Paenibacillus jiagnxiensis TaxID=3228926 RepID=UPI0033B7191E